MLEHFQVLEFKDPASSVAALEKTGFTAHGRKDLPPLPLRLPMDWNADPFADRNWMFQIHAWRMLDPYLNTLLAPPRTQERRPSDPPRHLSVILEIMADWKRDNILGAPGPLTWNDMATGLRAGKLALLITLARRDGWRLPNMLSELVDLHIAELSDREKLSDGNHGLFQLNGLMSLVHACPDDPRARAAKSYAIANMSAMIDSQLGAAGVHTENSPGYHFFVLRVFQNLLGAPWWRIPATVHAQDRLVAAKRARFWLADPAGRCVPVGDSSEGMVLRRFDGIEAWPHQRQDKVLGAAVDGYAMVRTAPELSPKRSSMLFLTASFRSGTHKHADCLSLVWQEAGRNILINSGKYGYQKDEMRGYFLSTRAHNTVEIDRKDFSRKASDAYGAGIRGVTPEGATWMIEAEAPHLRNGYVHRRQVLFRPGCFLLAVDHVRFTNGQAHQKVRPLTNWWHFNPGLRVSKGAGPGSWRASGLTGRRRLHISHVTSAENLRGACHLGEMDPRPQGWVSRAYLECEPAPALGFSAKTETDYFAATLFEIAEADAAPEISLDWHAAQNSIAVHDQRDSGSEIRSFDFGSFRLETSHAIF